MCRILDTVEDALWAKVSLQMRSFEELDRLIVRHSLAADIATDMAADSTAADLAIDAKIEGPLALWIKMFPPGLPEGEKLLLSDTSRIITDLKSAPEGVRKPIFELVRSMAAGMRHFAERRAEAQGRLELRGLKEVNQYCFFVAGIVGETLSKLLVAIEPDVKLTPALVIDSHHFGLFLQKVNLLKDQRQDELEGRFLVPSRDELFASLRIHAEGAMRYIENIPDSRNDYRVFCAWSLFLGLGTLPLLRAFAEPTVGADSALKIDRAATEALFARIEELSRDPLALRQYFNELVEIAGLPLALSLVRDSKAPALLAQSTMPPQTLALPKWFADSYSGGLSAADLQVLGLV